MNKIICLALLSVLGAGQAHAARGADPSKADANQARRTMEAATGNVGRAALKAELNKAHAKVTSSANARTLSPTEQKMLAANMIRDQKVNKQASEALADKATANAELSALALEVLANRKVKQDAMDAVLSPEAKDARDAEASLVDALLEAKTWKDSLQITNLKTFATEFNVQKRQSRKSDEAAALRAAAAKLKKETGIDLDWRKIKDLCTKKA